MPTLILVQHFFVVDFCYLKREEYSYDSSRSSRRKSSQVSCNAKKICDRSKISRKRVIWKFSARTMDFQDLVDRSGVLSSNGDHFMTSSIFLTMQGYQEISVHPDRGRFHQYSSLLRSQKFKIRFPKTSFSRKCVLESAFGIKWKLHRLSKTFWIK